MPNPRFGPRVEPRFETLCFRFAFRNTFRSPRGVLLEVFNLALDVSKVCNCSIFHMRYAQRM